MHPELVNRTPFALSTLLLPAEPDGLLHGVALVQGTWRIGPGGELSLVELQPQPPAGGEWYGDPATSSLRLEPQTASAKAGTDVVLLADAVAPGGRPVAQLDVEFQLGPLHKRARVFGDRELTRGLTGPSIGPPTPFERMPLVYERAYGGWDRRHADPSMHHAHPHNPVGVAYRDRRLPACDEARLPNIENPQQLYAGNGEGDALLPWGFGFVAPGWQPRAALAGTYDEAWDRARKPLLPLDFDPRFHQAASSGLVSATHLVGTERVFVSGVSAAGPCHTQLPAVPDPWCAVSLRRQPRRSLHTQLDTVIVDMRHRWLTLQWRARWPLPDGPHALEAVELRLPGLAAAPAGA